MMASWMMVEPTRRQVAIAGQVADAVTGRGLGGARVRLTQVPPGFVARLATLARLAPLGTPPAAVQAANATIDNPAASSTKRLQAAQVILDYLQITRRAPVDRPDETHTTAEGRFHFMDLPDGAYTLTAWLPQAGTRYGQEQVNVAVVRDGAGNMTPMGAANIGLRPTTLQGRIVASPDEPVSLAEVRVKGSGEHTFSDTWEDPNGDPLKSTKGRYRLTALEAGRRLLRVSAQGFKTADDLPVQLVQGETTILDIQLVR